MIVMDLCRQIQSLKCGEDNNVRTHFDTLANFCEQLAAMGTIPDNKYTSILLGSIPSTYEASTFTMSTTATLTNTALTPNTVIRLLTDKYNCCVLRKPKTEEGQDEALTADGGKKKKSKKDLECFNCCKCGHIKADCWAKGGGKEGQGPKRKMQDSTVLADQQQQPDIEAWAAIEDPLDEDAWTVVEETSEAWAVIEETPDEEPDQSNFACKPCTESELYDSGALCHMSPF